jgi:hypothetical protein
MSKIIISYRRLDSLDVTMRIRDVMATRFGESSVFTDIDSIPLGVDFLEHINSELSTCDALIAIIGPRWIDCGQGPGQGVHLETDFVRIEVEAALKRKIPVIPALVGGARMPTPGELPDALRPFAFRNGTSIDSGLNFRNDVNRLIRSLEDTLPHNKTQEVGERSRKTGRAATSIARANENTAGMSVQVQTEGTTSLTQVDALARARLPDELTPIRVILREVVNIAIYLRGALLPNAFFIPIWLLLAAAITIFLKPDSESLHISMGGATMPETFNANHFEASLMLLSLFGLFLLVWALWRRNSETPLPEKGPGVRVCAVMLILTLVIAFCELQPIALDGMFKSANKVGGRFAYFVDWMKALAVALAICLALVAFLRPQINLLLKEADGRRNFALRAAGKAAIYVAGAAIPFLLWIVYLYLAFGGIKDLNSEYVNWSGSYYHAPNWVEDISQHWFGYKTPIGWFYVTTAVDLFLMALVVKWLKKLVA